MRQPSERRHDHVQLAVAALTSTTNLARLHFRDVRAALASFTRGEIRMTYSLRRNRLTCAVLVILVLVVAIWTVPGLGQRVVRSDGTRRPVERRSALPTDE